MKVAVIGADGFIGSRVVESFHLGGGPSVVAVSDHPSRCALAARFTVDIRAADALDAGSLTGAMQGCGAVVHAVRGQPGDLKRLATTLCRAAADAGIKRVVYLSSASVHGPNPPPDTDEQSRIPTASLDDTAREQLAAERQVLTECRRLSVAAYALRPGVVYGPRSPLVAEIAAALRDNRMKPTERDAALINSIYIDNLVAAIRGCLRAKEGAGQPYLVGDAERITWRDFRHAIAGELDYPANGLASAGNPAVSSPPAEPPEQDGEARRSDSPGEGWKPSFQHAARQLGYAPAVGFPEAVRRSCAWWRFAQGDFFAAA
jgi:nucleoside-diphosphate-sugar epimerase